MYVPNLVQFSALVTVVSENECLAGKCGP